MVQQPFGGQQVAATTLAVPAIAVGQQQPQQQQYSPQANFYQQQLIKSAQQQFSQTQPRLNGLQQHYSTAQQESPNNIQPVEALYNALGQQQPQQQQQQPRPTPIYAPKPAYFGSQPQQQQQQQPQPLYQQQQQPRPILQQATYFQQQQQHSPASLVQLQQPVGLSVRQLPSNAPLQQVAEQRQQQPQQLIMSYQLQPSGSAYLHNQSLHEQLVQQHVDVRWSQIEEQQVQLQQHQQQQQRLVAPQPQVMDRSQRVGAFSDRDSISTVSRFNQFDERRSFTVRSQFTSANNANRNARNFSFLKLTSEALKLILGLGNGNSNEPPLLQINKQNLQRNLNLTVTSANGNNKNVQQFGGSSTKVTVIDSGEDYYFKRKVFKYQLIILRLVSLLCSAFVLLSPVAMLLIPKMETFFHQLEYPDSPSTPQTETSQSQTAPSITHAVGLNGPKRQAAQQQTYLAPQPQWRISECGSDCDGPLIGFTARLIMLCIAYWAIFFRAQTATLPRIDLHRCLLTSIAFLITSAYWLFFIFRVFDKRYNDFELQYMTIVQFALSMLESLVLLHYLAVVLLELRSRKKVYCLKVVRSPDGASKYYSCGSLSIQKCAQFVLEKYHRDFNHFGPYTQQLIELEDKLVSVSKSAQSGSKSPRSRPSSPTNSTHRGESQVNARASRRSVSRSSRHHSRLGASERSPSRSPARSTRSKSHGRSHESNSKSSNQVKLYQVDLNPPEQAAMEGEQTVGLGEKLQAHTVTNDKGTNPSHNSLKETDQNEKRRHENEDSNSADQSSDATSRMKESSLETIRAANSSSDLIVQQKRGRNSEEQQQRQQQSMRDETESVRSVRSRRSTSRSHHRHREHDHRQLERSSSRMNQTADAEEHQRHSHSIFMPNDPLEEHKRKLRRRKFRLLAAVQDTFEQIKQLDEANQPASQQQPMMADSNASLNPQQQAKQALGPNQAARSLYPNIARSLQKYLRLTRQTGRHNLQSIYEHLSKCLLYKLSARTFLEKFLNQDPVWQQSETNLFADCKLNDSTLVYTSQRSNELEINSWSLVCDTLLSRQLDSRTFFVLKQGQVSLLVTVAKLPHLNLSEEVIDQKSCKFILGPNSETSV